MKIRIWPSVFRQLRTDSTSTTHSSRSLFRLTSVVWSGNVQPRVLFINIFCECGVNIFFIYIVSENCLRIALQCDCSVLPFLCTVSHRCHSSSLTVTVKLRLVEKLQLMPYSETSQPSIICFISSVCEQAQDPKRWPRSFLHFSLTLDCCHAQFYIVNLLCSRYILVWQICMKHKVSLVRFKVVDASWLL